MTHRSDDKGTVISAVGTEVEYLQSLGATSNNVNDAWYQLFVIGGATALNWNVAAYQFLVAWGATSTCLPDMWAEYWAGGGGGGSYETTGKRLTGNAGNYYTAVETPVTNSTQFAFCAFILVPFNTPNQRYMQDTKSSTNRFRMDGVWNNAGGSSNNGIEYNLSATNCSFNVYTYENVHGTQADTWFPVLISVNSVTGAAHAYVNDVNCAVDITKNLNSGTIDWGDAGATFGVGYDLFGGRATPFDASHIWEDNTYIDFSVEANRRKFYDAALKPVSLGPTGELPTGVQPDIFVPDGDFTNNLGSKANWNKVGTINNSSTSPTD